MNTAVTLTDRAVIQCAIRDFIGSYHGRAVGSTELDAVAAARCVMRVHLPMLVRRYGTVAVWAVILGYLARIPDPVILPAPAPARRQAVRAAAAATAARAAWAAAAAGDHARVLALIAAAELADPIPGWDEHRRLITGTTPAPVIEAAA